MMTQTSSVGPLNTSPRGRLLIINGAAGGRADALYRELAALGWQTAVREAPAWPSMLRWYAIARSFRPGPARWRRSFSSTVNRLARTAPVFTWRSRLCRRDIEKAGLACDLIIQGGGMFAASGPRSTTRYAIVCDCTVKLGDGNPWSSVHFGSRGAAARWYALERELYHRASLVFSTSEYARRSLIGDYGVEPDRAVTIGLGPNVDAPDDLVRDRDYDGRTILYVGYEFERKGGDVLLAAFERVTAELPEAELLIAGPRSIARGLPPAVRLLGPVSRQQLSALHGRASVFVMPSLFDPSPHVFLEAMEHMLPCIGSDRCAIPEIIVDGDTGFLVPAGDAPALAERIVHLLRRPDLMRRMGERGRARVRERFTWRAVARTMDERLIELLAASSAA